MYLINLAIGPVQDFIAAALRTRDLWMGSWMLSEISKSAALALYQNKKVKLIFPCPDDKEQSDDKKQLEKNSDFNVANIILATVKGDEEAAINALQAAKKAAKNRWIEMVDEAIHQYQKLAPNHPLRKDIIESQKEKMLELFSAWMPFQDDYKATKEKIGQLMAARKNCRDFLPAATRANQAPFYGLPKSSLDGNRETILPESLAGDDEQRRKLRLGRGEQLDLSGLVKRLAQHDRSNQFTPTTRIAVESWLQKLNKQEKKDLKQAFQTLDPLVKKGVLSRVQGNAGIYRDLPFDAAFLYQDRLQIAKKEQAQPHLFEPLQSKLKSLYRKYGSPTPYYCLLLADGDRMGALLDQAKNEKQHRSISKQLAQFAAAVPDIVRQNRGHCIYSGGDDVLAMLPVSQSIQCADELRCCFKEVFETCEDLKDIMGELDKKPTLSAGLVIAHIMDPLGRVLQWAREAEKAAKQGWSNSLNEQKERNALAILLQPRSGSPLKWRAQWGESKNSDYRRLIKYRDWFRAKLSSKLPYELRDLVLQLGLDTGNQEIIDRLWPVELKRILQRKQPNGQLIDANIQNELLEDAKGQDPMHWINTLLIARWLASGEV